MDKKRFETIELVERRRKWPSEEKARIMEEALAAGASVAAAASRNGVCRSQIYGWLRQARAGKLAGISVSAAPCASFVPVKIEQPPVSPCPLPAATSSVEPIERRPSVVEIAFGNGRSMKVHEDIDPTVLARLAGALDGGKR